MVSQTYNKSSPETLDNHAKKTLERLVLKTHDNNFHCFQLAGNTPNRSTLNEFKQFVKKKNEKGGYKGFSIKIDDKFDQDSQYFFTRNNKGIIVATSRVTERTPEGILPFEMGYKPDGSQYRIDDNVVSSKRLGDINSFGASWQYVIPPGRPMWFEMALAALSINKRKRFPGFAILFSSLGAHVKSRGIEKVYCLLDEKNPQIAQVYTSAGFKPSAEFDEPIHFNDYGKEINGTIKPTQWHIMEMDSDTISYHAENTKLFNSYF